MVNVFTLKGPSYQGYLIFDAKEGVVYLPSRYSHKSSQNIVENQARSTFHYSKVDFRFISWIRCKCLRIDFVHTKYRKVVVKNVLFITGGVNRGMQIRRSIMIYWFIDQSAAKILPASEIRAKTLLLPAKSKIRAQKMAESAIRWNYRIRESVKISLWIRNPGKNIFKIRRSVHLFTPPCYECRFEFVTGYGMPGNDWRIPRIYSWFSHDVTKIQTKKLSLLLSFYFHFQIKSVVTESRGSHINAFLLPKTTLLTIVDRITWKT